MKKSTNYRELMEEFPDLFSEIIDSEISCGPGWFEIIRDLTEEAAKVPGLKVMQVKEKFGGLRYYVDSDNLEELNRFVEKTWEAGERSHRTCEDCGSTDGVKTEAINYWVSTLCGECRVKAIEKSKKKLF
jgi:ribosomal protein L37AE/L43A